MKLSLFLQQVNFLFLFLGCLAIELQGMHHEPIINSPVVCHVYANAKQIGFSQDSEIVHSPRRYPLLADVLHKKTKSLPTDFFCFGKIILPTSVARYAENLMLCKSTKQENQLPQCDFYDLGHGTEAIRNVGELLLVQEKIIQEHPETVCNKLSSASILEKYADDNPVLNNFLAGPETRFFVETLRLAQLIEATWIVDTLSKILKHHKLEHLITQSTPSILVPALRASQSAQPKNNVLHYEITALPQTPSPLFLTSLSQESTPVILQRKNISAFSTAPNYETKSFTPEPTHTAPLTFEGLYPLYTQIEDATEGCYTPQLASFLTNDSTAQKIRTSIKRCDNTTFFECLVTAANAQEPFIFDLLVQDRLLSTLKNFEESAIEEAVLNLELTFSDALRTSDTCIEPCYSIFESFTRSRKLFDLRSLAEIQKTSR